MSNEYEFDIYIKPKTKRGRHVRFVALLSPEVAAAVLAGIYATVDANGEDAGGGCSKVVRRNGRLVSKAQEDREKAGRHG